MRVTKFGHACVRIEHEGQVVVIDPGAWSEREAIDGATAVLVTHEHTDHLDLEHLQATDAPVFTIDAVARQIADNAPGVAERTTVVRPGERFDVGLPVEAIGEQHAIIHPELPMFFNSGYRITVGDQTLFHPGDAFTIPDATPDVLCLPVSAPWSKMSEVMDYARAVMAPTTLAIHDLVYSDLGLALADARMQSMVGDNVYKRLASGADL
ncbi:MAG: MBL fold metallo-hydrolase [Nocardioidaceae bacterium]|nr:MAG: MBL fold metallo-hydrolase [Nocardioidaceae bacterium]